MEEPPPPRVEDILEADELHMMKILVEDVILRVKIGKTTGEAIKTNVGIPQGDCLSPILFILYLAEALKPTRTVAKPPNFDSTKILMIDQQYADDVSWITNRTFNFEGKEPANKCRENRAT